MLRKPTFLLAASALAFAAAPAAAQTATPAGNSAASDDFYSTFTPSDAPNKDKIDYSIWDEAMKNLVVSMGPSLRQSAGTPPPSFGTRRIYGHQSRFRLEGTRLMFSFFDNDIRKASLNIVKTWSGLQILSIFRNFLGMNS